MKFDSLGCLIRERYEPGNIANLGDACAETSRICLLEGGHDYRALLAFNDDGFYLRHPSLLNTPGWDAADFSNDQFLPWLMALDLNYPNTANVMRAKNKTHIVGTTTLLSVGSWALLRKQYWLLNIANCVQGLLLKLPYRIGDGGRIVSSDGQVQDYPNMICTYLFLKRIGKWATLPASNATCMQAIERYYLQGADAEPNSTWIVNAYRKALTP